MSKPTDANRTPKGLLFLIAFVAKWTAQEKQRQFKKAFQFPKGGIVSGQLYQGESIINRKGGICCPPPTFSTQPMCKNVLNKTQIDAFENIKNINKLTK